jgi:PTS system ascorbate-specific IIA component
VKKREWLDRRGGRLNLLHELITRETIVLKEEVRNWKEAIQYASEPLLKKGWIEPEYVKAMIHIIETLGPYVVLTPHVAIAHARPDAGVNRLSMSLLRLKKSVSFGRGQEVHLIIILAAIDQKLHLHALSDLSQLLSEEKNIERLIHTEKIEEIEELIHQYSRKKCN